jgi:adenylosuccinate lyase
MANPNVLSERYATEQMDETFSPTTRIVLERELWIAVAKAQRKLGVRIPAEAIAKYESAKGHINMDRIGIVERRTKHDVAARIVAFNEAAKTDGYIHLGMTSRDVTDNVEQVQIKRASQLIFGKYISVLRHLVDKAKEYKRIYLTARTHHQPAQPTLLGRRVAMWAEELYHHLRQFESFIRAYPLRGLKGPVGTQSDMLRLLGSQEKVARLEEMVAKQLGFARSLDSPGQVYPRSLDYALISHLCALSSAPENFAKGMRLMAGYELVTEGFVEGQVGSSAMPHKMNTRSSERICALAELVKMYADGASRLAGDQWEEGDVSCSAVRRVIVPDAFYASDGLCETTLTVLNQMGSYPKAMEQELNRFLPFLATTEILLTAVKKGIPREKAHQIIKKHATRSLQTMSERGRVPDLSARLAKDPVFQRAEIERGDIDFILENKRSFAGNAAQQIDLITSKARGFMRKYPAESRYEPAGIL